MFCAKFFFFCKLQNGYNAYRFINLKNRLKGRCISGLQKIKKVGKNVEG